MCIQTIVFRVLVTVTVYFLGLSSSRPWLPPRPVVLGSLGPALHHAPATAAAQVAVLAQAPPRRRTACKKRTSSLFAGRALPLRGLVVLVILAVVAQLVVLAEAARRTQSAARQVLVVRTPREPIQET